MAEVDHQETPIGRLQRVADPGDRVLVGNRRQVDQLKGDVEVGHHPRLGKLSCERVRARFGTRPGEMSVEGGFAGVRWSDERDLAGSLRSE
jgi:hypothetical protein